MDRLCSAYGKEAAPRLEGMGSLAESSLFWGAARVVRFVEKKKARQDHPAGLLLLPSSIENLILSLSQLFRLSTLAIDFGLVLVYALLPLLILLPLLPLDVVANESPCS